MMVPEEKDELKTKSQPSVVREKPVIALSTVRTAPDPSAQVASTPQAAGKKSLKRKSLADGDAQICSGHVNLTLTHHLFETRSNEAFQLPGLCRGHNKNPAACYCTPFHPSAIDQVTICTRSH